jgi:flagellar motor switch protein FliG
MTGPEKAVLFLLSLDEEVARPIVRDLDEEQLRKLRTVAATMHEVSPEALEETYRDFVSHARRAVALPRGGVPYLRRLSAEALGEERASAVFDEAPPNPIARIEHAPIDVVCALLAEEPPQIAGALLSKLAAPVAASILASMDPERQAAVIAHVGRMTEVPASALEDMAAALAAALPSSEARAVLSVDGVTRAAEILKACGKESSVAILGSLEAVDGNLAADVRKAMFTFDDLARLDARAMRELLREVPTDRLTVALKGASVRVSSAVFAGLSARAAELIRDDLDVLGNVRKAEVEKARAEIVEIALRLEAEGKLDLSSEEAA